MPTSPPHEDPRRLDHAARRDRGITHWTAPTGHVFAGVPDDPVPGTLLDLPDDGAPPGHAEPRHAAPGHAEPGHAEPSHAEPSHAEPSHAESPGHPEPPF